MKKISIVVRLAAIAALVCAGCTDDGDSTGGREADMFLDRTNGTAYPLTVSLNPQGGGSVSRDPNKEGGYIPGEDVSVTAAAASNYAFTGWSGASASTANTVVITMDSGKTLTANFTRTYTLTVNMSPSGGGSVSRSPTSSPGRSDGVYLSGTQVTVRATAESGYMFTGWSGASTATSSPTNITINDNTTLTANFKRMYTLTVNTSGGGSVSRSPTNSTGMSDGTYLDGAKVTVKAAASSGYVFTKWTNASGAQVSTSQEYTATVTGNMTLTANFTPTYTLTVNTDGGGSVSRSPTNSSGLSGGVYVSGAQVAVTATASTGYAFSYWRNASGSLVSSSNPYTLTVSGNTTLTAVFEQNLYALTTNVSPSGGGNVSRSPSGNYTYGTRVTLTAEESSGYVFTGWSGASSSTSKSVTVTMDGPVTLTANFRRVYTLTVDANRGGSVSRNPTNSSGLSSGSYFENTSVTVTAEASSGYVFKNWTNSRGTQVSTSRQYTFTMNDDITLTANFDWRAYELTCYSEPANGGSVLRYPANSTGLSDGFYTENTSVVVIATPFTGYVFKGWSWRRNGTLVSTSESYAFKMDDDITLYAIFERSP